MRRITLLPGHRSQNGPALDANTRAVLACLLQPSPHRADSAAAAVVASLGLAGLGFAAGSLALFQLSLLLAAAVGGAALWLWPKPRIAFGVAVLLWVGPGLLEAVRSEGCWLDLIVGTPAVTAVAP